MRLPNALVEYSEPAIHHMVSGVQANGIAEVFLVAQVVLLSGGNLWAVTYAARKNLVFDAGFDKGLTGTSTHWEAFAGLTYLLPHRLWRK